MNLGAKILLVVIAVVGAVPVVLSLVIVPTAIGVLVDGWAISTLWNWYAVRFFGVPHMSVPVAIGLDCLVGVILGTRGYHPMTPPKDETASNKWTRVCIRYVYGPMAVLVGWIALKWL